MDAQRATLEPARMVRENDTFSAGIIKRSSAKLREYKTLSRMASWSCEQRQVRTSQKNSQKGNTANDRQDCPIESRSYDKSGYMAQRPLWHKGRRKGGRKNCLRYAKDNMKAESKREQERIESIK